MFARSLLFCSLLLIGSLANAAEKKFRDTPDGPAPPPTVRHRAPTFGSAAPRVIDSTTSSNDVVVDELEYLKIKYIELRSDVDEWLEDPNNHYIILPALIGGAAGIVAMILIWTIFSCRKRCCHKKKLHKRTDIEQRAGLLSTNRRGSNDF